MSFSSMEIRRPSVQGFLSGTVMPADIVEVLYRTWSPVFKRTISAHFRMQYLYRSGGGRKWMLLTYANFLKRKARVKRIFNFGLSLILLVLLAPAFLFIAIIIKVTSKGPVFFKQERIGKTSVPSKSISSGQLKCRRRRMVRHLSFGSRGLDDSFVHASSTGFLNY